jgi:Helix-turn-helix domain
MESNAKRLVSIPEARHLLGDIGHTTLYELINRGDVVKVNIGRRGFITSESLEAYVDRLSEASDCLMRSPTVRGIDFAGGDDVA